MTENGTAMTLRGDSGIEREGFGSRELERRGEVASTALASAAQAEVQARYVMALQRPRNAYDARSRMLAECKRPAFARVAIFRKPIGGGKHAEGLSIRFAEVAARAWGNLHVGREVITDDASKRVMRVHVTDLEANLTESLDLVVEKVVERRQLRDGQIPKGRRTNSYGDQVYLVDASEGELLTKQRAEEAKAKRTCVLAMIPGDVLDECKRLVYQVQEAEDAKDPEAAKKVLLDDFVGIGVKPSDVEAYLAHPLDVMTPVEIRELRGVGQAIADGVVTWAEALAAKTGASGVKPAEAEAVKNKIKENLEKRRGSKNGEQGSAPAVDANKGKPPSAPSRGKGLTDERRAAIAEQAGVPVATVELVEKLQGETPEMILRALRAEKLQGDEVAVSDILSQIRASS